MKNLRLYITAIFAAGALAFPALSHAEASDLQEISTSFESSSSFSLEKYGMLPIYGHDIKDGDYPIQVQTSSPLFCITDATLHVQNEQLSADLIIENPDTVSLYIGSSTEASTASSEQFPLLTESSEGTYTVSFPVESLNQEISCAVFSAQENQWYDIALLFDASSLSEEALLLTLPDYDLIETAIASYTESGTSNSTPSDSLKETLLPVEPMDIDLTDGEYAIEVELSGGSGKASVNTPTYLIVRDGKAYARLIWSSSNYDYMIVGTEKYLNLAEEDAYSEFEIPIACLDEMMPVIADTTAMGTPHEVDYMLMFYSESIGPKSQMPQEAAKRVVGIAVLIIVGGGVLNHFLNKRRRG